MLNRLILITATVFLFSACNEQEINQYPIKVDYNYFPLDSGFWREFAVTFINIDSASEVFDTTNYFLREEYNGWFMDAASDSAIRIERFYRDSTHHAWKELGVWQASIKDGEAHQVEENIRFMKLLFPVKLNSSWNGDKYNRLDTLQQYNYTITSIDQPFALNNLSFDSVLTVLQKHKSTIVDKVDFSEKYAYGIGLVSKHEIDVYSEITDEPSVPIENRVTKGTLYYQDIIAYGDL